MNVLDAFQSVSGWFSDGFSGFFSRVLYIIESGLMWVISLLNQCFSVMSGVTKVRYQGKTQSLLDVFFGNTVVEKVYWAMALIGILLCFVFAIIAVAKKAVDSGDRMKQSLGDILTGAFKGIIIIVSLTFIFNVVLSLSDKLFTQINYAFNHADSLGQEDTIEFTDEQFATMARVLDTIANYSLAPSYNSRYNLNSCYNEIRGDLQELEQQGVFDFYYVTTEGASWQSALQEIVNAADPSTDLSFDVYNTSISNALLKCMKLLQTDSSFAPLRTYTRQNVTNSYNVPLDRMVFLMCTMRAARNSAYNQNASIEAPLRGAYYIGEKSIYSYSDVSSDFNISSLDHIMLFLVSFKLIWDLAVIIFDCVARVFNMVFLYLVAPPFIGVMPLDEGGKFKQWTTAFVVQCFGVFGTLIAMRVLLLLIPIISGSDLVLFENSVLNQIGKFLLILGGMSTAKRASGVITGILADNAGYQAINASNLGDSVRNTMDHLRNRVTGYGDVGSLRKNDLGIRSMFSRDKNGGGSAQKQSGDSSGAQRYPGGGRDSGPAGGTTTSSGGGTTTKSSPSAEPTKVTNPTQPQPTEPTKITNPTQPQPAEPAKITNPTQPQPAEPTIPEAPYMSTYDTSNPAPEEPVAPPIPHWDAEYGAQVAPIPEAPASMPIYDAAADAAAPAAPEAPAIPQWNAEYGHQTPTVPEAPPMGISMPKLRPVPPKRTTPPPKHGQ